jgi:hypothetical protein
MNDTGGARGEIRGSHATPCRCTACCCSTSRSGLDQQRRAAEGQGTAARREGRPHRHARSAGQRAAAAVLRRGDQVQRRPAWMPTSATRHAVLGQRTASGDREAGAADAAAASTVPRSRPPVRASPARSNSCRRCTRAQARGPRALRLRARRRRGRALAAPRVIHRHRHRAWQGDELVIDVRAARAPTSARWPRTSAKRSAAAPTWPRCAAPPAARCASRTPSASTPSPRWTSRRARPGCCRPTCCWPTGPPCACRRRGRPLPHRPAPARRAGRRAGRARLRPPRRAPFSAAPTSPPAS